MKELIFIYVVFLNVGLQAQPANYKYLVAKKVFDDVSIAFGNPKAPPSFSLMPGKNVVAQYVSSQASIQLDEEVYDICTSFEADSLNALAAILSHELAHYYKDHQWCSDYAYIMRNTTLGAKLKAIHIQTRLEKEGEADVQGLFHAAMGGYYAFQLQEQLLDKIYKVYGLPDEIKNYPSKADRKLLGMNAEKTVLKLYQIFEKGIAHLNKLSYDSAIAAFESINQTFPSRENYSNIGIARTLKALYLKPLQAREFKYPLEIDHQSRLKKPQTRSGSEENRKLYFDLLNAAKKDFEKAILLDERYYRAYVNLATVYDLLGNYEAAIGKIKELPDNVRQSKDATLVIAIAFYHLEDFAKAQYYFNILN